MTKHIFDITQDGERLTLMKCCGPAFEKLIFLSVFTFLFGLCAYRMHVAQTPINGGATWTNYKWIFALVTLISAAILCLEMSNFWRVLKGEYWTFDLEQSQLEHNSEVALELGEVSCIKVVRDEDGLCNELWIVPRQGAPIILENDSQGRMETLTATAQRISEFTGIEIVREDKRC